MMVRSRAAICGAVSILAVSTAATARPETASSVTDSGANSTTIVGAASMYNPYRPGYLEGSLYTASGERYDPSAWAAAIQTELRTRFGGVGAGTRPSYALVESGTKKAIVKINDVGPLKPGWIIDFDERTMQYFDPTLRLGVIRGVRVTPLPGYDWTPGPIAAAP